MNENVSNCFLKHMKQDVIMKDSITNSLHKSLQSENNANCLMHTQFRLLRYLLIIPTLCFLLLEHLVFNIFVTVFDSGA